MQVAAKIDVSTPTGRRIMRDLEKNRNVVTIDNPFPVDINGLPLESYTIEEAFDQFWDKLSEHYGVDMKKL